MSVLLLCEPVWTLYFTYVDMHSKFCLVNITLVFKVKGPTAVENDHYQILKVL